MLADLAREVYANLDAEWQRAAQEYERQAGSKLPCGPGCADCCKGDGETPFVSIPMRQAEAELLTEAWNALPAPARTLVVGRVYGNHSATCLLLSPDNLCLMYETRPMWCRIFGLPGIMSCAQIPMLREAWVEHWTDVVYEARLQLIGDDGFVTLPTLVRRWAHDR